MKTVMIKKHSFTLIEALIAVGLFSFIALLIMETFDGTKKNIDEMVNREEVTRLGLKVLSEVQESIHQAAEIYNHVPVDTSNDAEANLFYQKIDWDQLPPRLGASLGNPEFHNRLADMDGQTQALTSWINENEGNDYAARFHTNDLLISLPPVNGPGIPADSRGYAGNVLLLARHLSPIEIVMSPTDTDFEDAKINTESHLYNQTRLKGNQILVYTGADEKPGEERMYSIDVVRFEVYYVTEDTTVQKKKMVASTNESIYRENSLRLIKGESSVYLVHNKIETLKRNLDKAMELDPDNTPDDFTTIFNAITSTSDGVYFDNIRRSVARSLVYQTIEYTDDTNGPVIRDLSLAGSDGFSSNPTGDLIEFPDNNYHTFLDGYQDGRADISVAYNTKWTTGEEIIVTPGLSDELKKAKHVPWFAQQPELNQLSPASEYFPSGFEVVGAGAGNNQRVGLRLCLWLRTMDRAAAYSHFMIGARAQ